MDDELRDRLTRLRDTGQLDAEFVKAIKSFVQAGPAFIQMTDVLIDQTKELIKLITKQETNNDERDGLIRQFQSQLAELEQSRFETLKALKRNEFLSLAFDALPSFELDALPDDVRDDYVAWILGYEASRNSHYVIEIFTRLVKAGISPPKWVLENLAIGFGEYMRLPTRDADALAKKLGLGGKASGDKPWLSRALRSQRAPAMTDMAILIQHFKLSKSKAAEAVKIQYELTEAKSTLLNYFRTYWGDNLDSVTGAEFALPMKEADRVRFLSGLKNKAARIVKTHRPK